ncbi:Protein of unknown function CGGC region [Solidesulfovibrio fructosivorans JJ]]|uniref:CGGC domain-containing protein n=1 Tax=Solidesulfovibrio fructosivorans JJ] TaxID=596151 RepID=E1JSS7_SOLFR|nr:CGGC domain-containing protein [Solidesulfovibrio fructosivorans]EFL52560.1 Protein of unknown function CGGC region [Solidesulfovibrio fructosivorans JJ]]
MTKIGLIRCEKNETTCPLTGCLSCLASGSQGFAGTDHPELVGVMTCRCPGDRAVALAKVLKAKGAEILHWCTCTFAHKEEGKWVNGNGFCADSDSLLSRIAREAGIPCVKGTAHLPHEYRPK